MKSYCYFNNKITMLDKVKISPYDLGFLRGYGVFDFMITANGKPFMPDDHWKRLENSARELNLAIPITRKKYDQAVRKLLRLNGYKKSVIRTVLTGGASRDGITPSGNGTFLILIEKPHPLPRKAYQAGAGVITVEYLRDCPVAKITNYVMAIKNLKEKIRREALEIIYTHRGRALEAATSNFFIIKNSIVITPCDDILFGVTRKVAIRLAKKKGLKIKEREVPVKELYSADEVFLTASNKDIVPVVKIDSKKIGSGKPGKITRTLMEEFKKFVRSY